MMKYSSKMFAGLAFDSGGVTAGGLTSAFLTPFALGIALAVNETTAAAGGTAQSILTNGFGIIAFMSAVPLIAVQTLGIIYEARSKKQTRLSEQIELDTIEELKPMHGETVSETAGFKNVELLNLYIITGRSAKEELLKTLLASEIHLINTIYGRGGMAHKSNLSHTLGFIPEDDKVMITCISTCAKIEDVLKMLEDRFEFNKPNTGVAFTVRVDEVAY
jgi:hypothetical protein